MTEAEADHQKYLDEFQVEKRQVASQQMEVEATRFNFEQLKKSIDVFKTILPIWESEGKGFLYTDDPKHCEMFEEFKKEHDKMIETIVRIRNHLERSNGNDAILEKNRELYMLCDGFRSMIDEVEVEESAIKYIGEIEKVYREMESLLLVVE